MLRDTPAQACLVLAVTWLGAVQAGAQASPSAPAPAEKAAIDACLEKMPERVQVAIALVQGDTVRFLGAERTAQGVRLIENRSSVFQIGSMTKVFTATLFAQQVTTGALKLEDTVASRVPFQLKVSGRDGVAMTLVHLASHTSGIAHHQPPGFFRHALLHFHPDEPLRDFDRARFVSYLKEDLKLDSTPGTRYFYSNIGMSLLGLVIEERTGRSFEALLQDRIFKPGGMTGSTTDIALVRERVVPGLKVNGKPYPNQFFAALSPAGGIYTCTQDLARFARVQIDRIDPAVVLSQQPVFTMSEGEQVALGWHVYDWVQGWRTLNHNGGIGGYTSSLYVDTANRCASMVLSNVMNEGDFGEAVRVLARTLLKQLEPKAAAPTPRP